MSKTVYDVTLLELLPPNLRNDPDIVAASAAVDKEYQILVQSIPKCLTYGDIDNASPEVLDMLAAEMDVMFYDPTFPLATRRAIVKNAYLYKFHLGTAYAVQQVVSNAFANAEVREWFEYGGVPYRFKIVVNDELGENVTAVIDAVNKVKNLRSKLESITATQKTNLKIYYGIAMRRMTYHCIPPQETYTGYTASIMGVGHYITKE